MHTLKGAKVLVTYHATYRFFQRVLNITIDEKRVTKREVEMATRLIEDEIGGIVISDKIQYEVSLPDYPGFYAVMDGKQSSDYLRKIIMKFVKKIVIEITEQIKNAENHINNPSNNFDKEFRDALLVQKSRLMDKRNEILRANAMSLEECLTEGVC